MIKELQKFGWLVGGIFLVIGFWPARLWAVILGCFLMGSAFLYPQSLYWPHRFWLGVGHVLGWINTRLILGLLFYLLVTPMGLGMRLFGFKSIRRKEDHLQSYKEIVPADKAIHMEKQF